MRIGLSGRTSGGNRIGEQALDAEKAGFTSIWYAGGAGGDPLLAAAVGGQATTNVEVGTSIVQTYPCHPALMASRATALADLLGPDRLVLGIGASHEPVIAGMYGLSYDRPGTHMEEYLSILLPILGGKGANVDGSQLKAHIQPARGDGGGASISVMVAALGPRMLHLAGEHTAGTILWMANARAIESYVAPALQAAASAAGRPSPRIVAGLPVAVHDDVDEARADAGKRFALYGSLPNYQHILERGGAAGPADAVVVGDEDSVARQLQGLLDAGATDLWTDVFPVGEDRNGSRARTMALLTDLASR